MRRSWIKIETNTPDKPEICVIASQLRLDSDSVMGKLIRLWSWAELNVSKSNETSVTLEFLDKLVGKKGFSLAMIKAGWLIQRPNGLEFPNFSYHNGRAAKGRAQTALRVSRHRAQKAQSELSTKEVEIAETPLGVLCLNDTDQTIVDAEPVAVECEISEVTLKVSKVEPSADLRKEDGISKESVTTSLIEHVAPQVGMTAPKRKGRAASRDDAQALLF